MVRDAFVSGLQSSKLISTLIPECDEKTFEQCVERAKILQQVTRDVEDMHPTSKVYAVHPKTSKPHGGKSTAVPKNFKCVRCLAVGLHWAHDCWALQKKCAKCGTLGHLARACLNKKFKGQKEVTKQIKPEEAKVEAQEEDYLCIRTITEDGGQTLDNGSFLDQSFDWSL